MSHIPEDSKGGFIKYEGSNMLYNLYDAGNFLTGKSFQMLGGPLRELQKGAHVNNWLTHGFTKDSPADQRAISNGWNFTGVLWGVPGAK